MVLTEEGRQKIIDALIEDWLDCDIEENIRYWLVHGRRGYADFTDEELVVEAENNVDWVLEELEEEK